MQVESAEKLTAQIREYINKFGEDLKNDGRIEYKAANSDYLLKNKKSAAANKIIKTIIAIWIAIATVGVAIFIYKEFILPMNMDIPLNEYILFVAAAVVLIAIMIAVSAKCAKRVDSIVLRGDVMTVRLLNSKMQTEKSAPVVYKYNTDKMLFTVKRRRDTVDNDERDGVFNVYITYENKRSVMILDAEKEEELFAFLLYLESHFNGLCIDALTDDMIYRMYNSHRYSLKLKAK